MTATIALWVGIAATSPNVCRLTETITIPHNLYETAEKRARLIKLLQESIHDASQGILNAKRETEIRKLMKEIEKEK